MRLILRPINWILRSFERHRSKLIIAVWVCFATLVCLTFFAREGTSVCVLSIAFGVAIIFYLMCDIVNFALEKPPLHSEIINEMRKIPLVNLILKRAVNSIDERRGLENEILRRQDEILAALRVEWRFQPFDQLVIYFFKVLWLVIVFSLISINFYYLEIPLFTGLTNEQIIPTEHFYAWFLMVTQIDHNNLFPVSLWGRIMGVSGMICAIVIILVGLNFLCQTVGGYINRIREAIRFHLYLAVERQGVRVEIARENILQSP